MRTHLLAAGTAAVALCLSTAAGASAASIWTPVASGTASDITTVDYRAADQLYYATSAGQILKDGAPVATFPGTNFRDLKLNPSGTAGVAVANAGKLYRFNGATWSLVSLANTSFAHSFPCSGGGGPFTRTYTPTGNLTAVDWKDDSTVYVTSAERGVVLKSVNGGVTWLDVSRQADGTCRLNDLDMTDVATAGGDNVFFVTDGFAHRYFSADGLASTPLSYGDSAVNCFGVRMQIAVDPVNPNRNMTVGDCEGTLSYGFSEDGGINYTLGQAPRNGSNADMKGLTDVAYAGDSWLIPGKAGTILVTSDGRNTYLQRADGALATTDWLAGDKFDATNAAVGGRNGALAITTQANAIPDIVAPAGTISGPTTVTAGQAVSYTANVADNAGGSGINPASFAWSATGIPAATGNPVSVTFPSAGFYTLTVTFADNSGNAGTATLGVFVRAAGGGGTTVPPGTIPPGTVNPLPTKTVTVAGGTVTLSGPKSCVGVGRTFSATLSFKKSRRKGAKFVKVRRVDFFIDGKRVKIDRKAPFKQRLSVKSYKPNSKHTLKARAYIKVKRGKAPKKSITTSFQVCSA